MVKSPAPHQRYSATFTVRLRSTERQRSTPMHPPAELHQIQPLHPHPAQGQLQRGLHRLPRHGYAPPQAQRVEEPRLSRPAGGAGGLFWGGGVGWGWGSRERRERESTTRSINGDISFVRTHRFQPTNQHLDLCVSEYIPATTFSLQGWKKQLKLVQDDMTRLKTYPTKYLNKLATCRGRIKNTK